MPSDSPAATPAVISFPMRPMKPCPVKLDLHFFFAEGFRSTDHEPILMRVIHETGKEFRRKQDIAVDENERPTVHSLCRQPEGIGVGC